jgi:hypothetical protein
VQAKKSLDHRSPSTPRARSSSRNASARLSRSHCPPDLGGRSRTSWSSDPVPYSTMMFAQAWGMVWAQRKAYTRDMAQYGQQQHDDTVREAATALKEARPAASIFADHVHGFGEKQEVPSADTPIAAVFVPTQALFSKYIVLSTDDLDWKTPDIVVKENGLRYLVEVGSCNESFVRAARKLESMIYAAKRWNVCGIALVSAPCPGAKSAYLLGGHQRVEASARDVPNVLPCPGWDKPWGRPCSIPSDVARNGTVQGARGWDRRLGVGRRNRRRRLDLAERLGPGYERGV